MLASITRFNLLKLLQLNLINHCYYRGETWDVISFIYRSRHFPIPVALYMTWQRKH
ncbi:protein of unknown function [Xenorhabdus doucetiae]|uniref:Uncharacterized protein n=1 Tax=Xenorhabdus doucetiae TaxID=351671 RepID=A0A068QQY0_9GAMM|nr:protein of unknown function [Xenorhabdus doucetiae]